MDLRQRMENEVTPTSIMRNSRHANSEHVPANQVEVLRQQVMVTHVHTNLDRMNDFSGHLDDSHQEFERSSEPIHTRKPFVGAFKQVNIGELCELLVNYFILEKMKDWHICLYHVEFEPNEFNKEVAKDMLRQHPHEITFPCLFDGTYLVLMQRLPDKISEFICKNSSTDEMSLMKVTLMKEFSSLNARFLHILKIMKMALHKNDSCVDLEPSKNQASGLDKLNERIGMHSASREFLFEDLSAASDASLDDLRLFDVEPETWVETVGKEFAGKLEERERKRQEAIYELIKTEKRHCRMLSILKEDFADVMLNQLGLKDVLVARVFPFLDDLINIHLSFLWFLREEQRHSKAINSIGDLLYDQFTGSSAQCFKEVYSESYSKRKDAVATYRALEKSEKRFQEFVYKTANHPLMNKKGIPEATLFITHRMTQYPLLIEKIVKYTPVCELESKRLRDAHDCVKGILVAIDAKVAKEENCKKLREIQSKMDAKSSTMFRGHKFDKFDFINEDRRLKFEGNANLCFTKNTRAAIPIVAVLLSDVVCLLHEVNQKYYFLSLDGEFGVFPLADLEAHEKPLSDANSILILCKDECVFELECIYPKERRRWIDAFRCEPPHHVDDSPLADCSLRQRRALWNMQKQMRRERYQIRKKREELERSTREQREEMQKERDALQLQKEDIEQQRDDLFRKSEALKNQGILLPSTLPPPALLTTPGNTSIGHHPRSSPSLSTSFIGSTASLPRLKKRNSSVTVKREASIKPAETPKQVLPMKLAKLGTG